MGTRRERQRRAQREWHDNIVNNPQARNGKKYWTSLRKNWFKSWMKSAAKNSAAEAIKRATSWETLWKCQAGRGCGLVAVCYSWDMLAAIYTLGSLSLSLSLFLSLPGNLLISSPDRDSLANGNPVKSKHRRFTS